MKPKFDMISDHQFSILSNPSPASIPRLPDLPGIPLHHATWSGSPSSYCHSCGLPLFSQSLIVRVYAGSVAVSHNCGALLGEIKLKNRSES